MLSGAGGLVYGAAAPEQAAAARAHAGRSGRRSGTACSVPSGPGGVEAGAAEAGGGSPAAGDAQGLRLGDPDGPAQAGLPLLSVVVAVTSGGAHVEQCLRALGAQEGAPGFEVLVPVDERVPEAASWRVAYLGVRFPEVGDSAGLPADAEARGGPGAEHLAYDRRRAAGLAAARGRIVALTEDHARPAPDWCRRIAEAHRRRPEAAIGGAVENAVDRPLNQAVYFCDFGRYQRPLPEGPARCASDVNVSYKRAALERVAATWTGSYHETAVHGALLALGESIWIDPRIVVYQDRGPLRLGPALRERFAWGRLYAGKRTSEVGRAFRLILMLGAPLLPALLLARKLRAVRARGRTRRAFARALPLVALLLIAWSAGECAGYWTGRPVAGSH